MLLLPETPIQIQTQIQLNDQLQNSHLPFPLLMSITGFSPATIGSCSQDQQIPHPLVDVELLLKLLAPQTSKTEHFAVTVPHQMVKQGYQEHLSTSSVLSIEQIGRIMMERERNQLCEKLLATCIQNFHANTEISSVDNQKLIGSNPHHYQLIRQNVPMTRFAPVIDDNFVQQSTLNPLQYHLPDEFMLLQQKPLQKQTNNVENWMKLARDLASASDSTSSVQLFINPQNISPLTQQSCSRENTTAPSDTKCAIDNLHFHSSSYPNFHSCENREMAPMKLVGENEGKSNVQKLFAGEHFDVKLQQKCEDAKAHRCNCCNKLFRFKSNLFEHKSLHSNKRMPFLCPFCGKTCRLKGNLKKHLQVHVNTVEDLERLWTSQFSRSSGRPRKNIGQKPLPTFGDDLGMIPVQNKFVPRTVPRYRHRRNENDENSSKWAATERGSKHCVQWIYSDDI